MGNSGIVRELLRYVRICAGTPNSVRGRVARHRREHIDADNTPERIDAVKRDIDAAMDNQSRSVGGSAVVIVIRD